MCNNPKISIIVPVYKVERYIKRCIDSVLSQTYKNIEVILVDDGSPDSCGRICDEYADKDKRVIVIHKKNGGLSDARNAGLDIATGEFIGFVDSDDYISEFMYEELIKAIYEKKADIAICKAVITEEGQDVKFEKKEKYSVYKGNATWAMVCKNAFTVNAWNKLYRRILFRDIRYPVGMLYEDLATTYKVVEKARIVVTLESELYAYVQRCGSIMNKTSFMMQPDKIIILEEMWTHFSKYETDIKEEFFSGIVQYFMNDIFRMLGSGNLIKNQNYQKALKYFLKGKKKIILKNKYVSIYQKMVLLMDLYAIHLLQTIFNHRGVK